MGWQDAPVIESKPAWMDAPEIGAKSERPASLLDRAAGTQAGRTLLGAASPLIGLVQLGANAYDAATGQPGPGQYVNDKVKALEESKQRGMKYEADQNARIAPGAFPLRGMDTGNTDAMGVVGSLAPAAKITNAITKALPQSTSMVGKMAAGATSGGTVAASTPVTQGEDYWTDKANQTGTGVAIGGLIPPAAELVKTIGSGVKSIAEPLYESGRAAILKRYQESLLGNNPDTKAKVIEALQNSQRQGPLAFVEGSNPTAGEAISSIPEATGLASHQRAISKVESLSPAFNARSAEQEAARRASIGSVAQTPSALEQAVKARAEATAPMREKALAQANMKAAPAQPTPKPDDTLKSAVEIHGQSTPKPLKTGLQMTNEAFGLERNVTPLKASSLVKQVHGLASQPGMRVNDVVTKSIGELEEKIAGAAQKNGLVNSRDLYMIRKEAGNIVKKYADENKNFDQRLTAGLVKDVQGYIDDAIEGAGGKGWKDYLAKYQDMSKPINQMQVGQELEKVLTSPSGATERGAMFSKAVQDAPQTLKKSTGSPRYTELDDVLNPEQSSKVKAVAEELARKDAYKGMAAKTNFSGAKAIHEGAQFPNMLSRTASVANAVLKHLTGNAGDKINKLAAQQYLNPQMLADALKDVPPTPRQLMIDAIMQRAGVPSKVGATAVAARQF